MSVAKAQREIDSKEYAEWVAYATVDGMAIERTEFMLALIACILANVHRTKGSKEFRPEDFIPRFGTRSRRDTPDEIMVKLRAAFPDGNDK